MQQSSKIYVAGHRGLAGSAILRALHKRGHANIVTRRHAELDLGDASATRDFFQAEKPDYVFLAAAKVGGSLANDTYSAEFIRENLAIQTNVIHEAWRAGVKRLLFLGSSCVYPKEAPQPIKEEYFQTGPLEITNRPYAIAKTSGVEMCWAYNRQYGTKFLAAMPTNLYGPGDNYDLASSHVLPALIRKCHNAKVNGDSEVPIWGTGKPRREFLYSDDMGEGCVHLLQLPDADYETALHPDGKADRHPLINLGVGADIPISELAALVAQAVGFKGALTFDTSKPDGTLRKVMDVSRLRALGWQATTTLDQGLAGAYRAFLATLDTQPFPFVEGH